LRLLHEDARFRAAVREGIAQADRGEFIEEEEWTPDEGLLGRYSTRQLAGDFSF
jgi:predicted transcriptional regulator